MNENELNGQREIALEGFEATAEELALIEQNGSSVDELVELVKAVGASMTINAALGAVAIYRAGKGQVRNEPFNGSEPDPDQDSAPAKEEPSGEAPSSETTE